LFNPKKYPWIKRPKWLEEGDKERSQKELEELTEEWQHRLGLCSFGIQAIKVLNWEEGGVNYVSSRYVELKANCERIVVHELLHVLFRKRDSLLAWKEEEEVSRLIKNKDELKAYEEKYKLWDELMEMLTERIIFQLTNALLKLKYGEK